MLAWEITASSKFDAPKTANLMNETGKPQSLYLGTDWLMYVGPEGYERSEMLSPAIVLSEPEGSLVCDLDGVGMKSVSSVFHPANKWSSAEAEWIAIIYFDPLTLPGRVIQLERELAQGSPSAISSLDWSADLYLELASANVTSSEVERIVSLIKSEILKASDLTALDERISRVAQKIQEDYTGRLDLQSLAESVDLSPDYLRHLFKQHLGMTLSKYKSWTQVRSMLNFFAGAGCSSFDWDAREGIQQAGFYDDAHGYHAFNKYFGGRGSLTGSALNIVRCSEQQI